MEDMTVSKVIKVAVFVLIVFLIVAMIAAACSPRQTYVNTGPVGMAPGYGGVAIQPVVVAPVYPWWYLGMGSYFGGGGGYGYHTHTTTIIRERTIAPPVATAYSRPSAAAQLRAMENRYSAPATNQYNRGLTVVNPSASSSRPTPPASTMPKSYSSPSYSRPSYSSSYSRSSSSFSSGRRR